MTVVPDRSKTKVLIKGMSQGSKVSISFGGHTLPTNSEGNKLASKYAQNHATKNITSDAINKVIPYLWCI